jgi:predicted hotdog family 3-hydroxylacyl-ACP dehydratase
MNAPQTLTRDGIAALIPHSGTMCLLDHLERWDTAQIVCTATNHRDADHPLRTRSGLLATCAIEYAAQAMALHGALIGQAGAPGAATTCAAAATPQTPATAAIAATPATPVTPATPGYLASARGVQLHVLRLDDLPASADPVAADELRIEATRQAGDARQILYAFSVSHAGRPVADGRAAVVLNTALAS